MASNLSLTIKYVQILCQHLPFTPLNASAACYECMNEEHDMTGLFTSMRIRAYKSKAK